ncbi:MAG: agmatine deiminase family protein [Bacteroidota bacterium]|nr:agmatine deiminase family protein [Bacteroidota bacterium]
MKKILLTLLLVLLLCGQTAFSQTTKEVIKQKKLELLQKREKMTAEQIHQEYSNRHITRKPKKENLSKVVLSENQKARTNFQSKAQSTLSLPEDIIYPIESDEVQAILMTWSYTSKSVSGDIGAMPVFEDKGIIDYSDELVDIYSVPDVASNSDIAVVFAKLADAIQKHTQVWINIWAADDSTTIKNYMQQRGTPLTNYRFFINPGNAFWYRDCGPVAFYYGDNDDIAFMDFEYYGLRPLDNDIPVRIAEQLGIPVYTSAIEYEGGNILLDGLGTLITTSAVYESNMDDYGLAYLDDNSPYGYYVESKEPLTEQQVEDSLKYLLNLSKLVVLPALQYDGGTGHIDLYCDMWEETGFVVAQYPQALSSWADYQRVSTNLDSLSNMENYFGNKYFISRIPLPARNDGNWYSSQANYSMRYTRSFSNHTFVNDAIIQPVFYDTTLTGTAAGDIEGNRAAIEIMKEKYPGYTFEEIDVRSFDGSGGALHCITKQIPAENPVRIYHQPLRYINTTIEPLSFASLNILAQNKSGISEVKVFYRYASDNDFTELSCYSMGSNMYGVDIPLQANVTKDTIFYYISATSNNGKTITKPMTAPLGYYTLPYGTEINGVLQADVYGNGTYNWVSLLTNSYNTLNSIGQVYPTPATNRITIDLPQSNQKIYYRVVNLKGQVLLEGKTESNSSKLGLDVSSLKAGNYWISFTDGNFSTVRKIIVAR